MPRTNFYYIFVFECEIGTSIDRPLVVKLWHLTDRCRLLDFYHELIYCVILIYCCFTDCSRVESIKGKVA